MNKVPTQKIRPGSSGYVRSQGRSIAFVEVGDFVDVRPATHQGSSRHSRPTSPRTAMPRHASSPRKASTSPMEMLKDDNFEQSVKPTLDIETDSNFQAFTMSFESWLDPSQSSNKVLDFGPKKSSNPPISVQTQLQVGQNESRYQTPLQVQMAARIHCPKPGAGAMDRVLPIPLPTQLLSSNNKRQISHAVNSPSGHGRLHRRKADDNASDIIQHFENLKIPSQKRAQDMTIDEALEHLLRSVKNDVEICRAAFLHVTPRYNVEQVNKDNFYDLVVLESPGDPSGVVWQRGSTSRQKKAGVLEPHQVMQLSLKGLLIPSSYEDGGQHELMPLVDYLEGKRLVAILRSTSFFGYFKELKYFLAWKHLARKFKVQSMRKLIAEKSFYSDAVLVSCILYLRSFVYDMERDVELFCFTGAGCSSVSKYLTAQIEHLAVTRTQLVHRLTALNEHLTAQYELVTGADYLRERTDDVKAHHPYQFAEEAGSVVDWANLRSILRIKSEFKEKMENIMILGQYLVDVVLEVIIKTFLDRLHKLIKGVTRVQSNPYRDNYGYWKLYNNENSIDSMAQDDDKGIDKCTDKGAMWPVSEEWEGKGSHMCLTVSLCLGNTVLMASDLTKMVSLSKSRIKVLPGKFKLMEQVHDMYGSLGVLLESLPNLRRHAIISGDKVRSDAALFADVEVDEAGTAFSSKFFSRLYLCPILNKSNSLDYSKQILSDIQQAYCDAANIQYNLVALNDIFKKLHGLNPEHVIKQMERSMLLQKMKEIMDLPELLDDIKRINTREKGRINAMRKCVKYLDASQSLVNGFPNMKHLSGFVTSYKENNEVMAAFRFTQRLRLFRRLPEAFSMRCMDFMEYCKLLEGYFELTNTSLSGLLNLMRKLKFIDSVMDSFKIEEDIIDSLYVMLQAYDASEETVQANISSDVAAAAKSKQSKVRRPAVVDPAALYKNYMDVKDRLFAIINQRKSLILGELTRMKTETLLKRKSLHDRTSAIVDLLLSDSCAVVSEKVVRDPLDMITALRKIGISIAELRIDVNDMVSNQLLLVEGHDIIGVSQVVLQLSEVDKFADTDHLELIYSYRNKAWNSIVEATTLKRKVQSTRLASCDVKTLNDQLDQCKKTYKYLKVRLHEESTLNALQSVISWLSPKIEMISYLSNTCLVARHWHWMADNVLPFCGLSTEFSGLVIETLSVTDVTGLFPLKLGVFQRVEMNDLVKRCVYFAFDTINFDICLFSGLDKHLDKIRHITAEAAMESMIEQALTDVDSALKAVSVVVSMEWLRDSRLRDKIYFELHQATNLTQLKALVQYCRKSAIILDNTAQDMNITCYGTRLEQLHEVIQQMEFLLLQYSEIQYLWEDVFIFIKFSAPGDLDRDSSRLFQNCTEDLKKIESTVQQKSCNLYLACQSMIDRDVSVESLSGNLMLFVEDSHSNIQSLLDSCPRLSLLSYSRMVVFVKAWLMSAHQSELISLCMHEMFENVGTLHSYLHASNRCYMCTGFSSFDRIENVAFHSEIPFSLPIDVFVRQFEEQLRAAVSKNCDLIILERIKSLRALLIDTTAYKIVENMTDYFNQRLHQLFILVSHSRPNQSFTLVNGASFAEDVWVALGNPTGSILLARPDLSQDKIVFSKAWKESLHSLLSICKDNIRMLQNAIKTVDNTNPPISLKNRGPKTVAFLSSLLQQEIAFLRIVDDVLQCTNLDSALEYWGGRYQIIFLYNKDHRVQQSPFEVTLGCMTIPHGLEYEGASIKVVPNLSLENALHRVVGAACAYRATVFVSHDQTDPAAGDAKSSLFSGEYSLSCKDVAAALGRIVCTLPTIHSATSVRFFLGRLVYLEAVGCLDFSTVDHASLRILIATLGGFWAAIEKKNDFYIQDSLKFPFPKSKFSRTDLQLERRKQSSNELRSRMNLLTRANIFNGLLVVGFTSETQHTDSSILDYITRSIFNVVAVENYHPVKDIGMHLTIGGFTFGLEVGSIYEVVLLKFLNAGDVLTMLLQLLSSNKMVCRLAARACQCLISEKRLDLEHPPVKMELLKLELECFFSLLWEEILLITNVNEQFRRTSTVVVFQAMCDGATSRLDDLTGAVFRMELFAKLSCEHMAMSWQVKNMIIQVAQESGMIGNSLFIEHCVSFWNVVGQKSSSMVMLHGDSGCGFSRLGWLSSIWRSRGPAAGRWKAQQVVSKCVRLWLNKWRNHRGVSDNESSGIRNPMMNSSVLESESELEGLKSKSAAKRLARQKAAVLHQACIDVRSSFIHHSALSFASFYGCFDSQNRWNDGLLLRVLRDINNEFGRPLASSQLPIMHVLILQGPVGPELEQMFAAAHFQCSRTTADVSETLAQKQFIFPSGEIYCLPPNARVVVETHDISAASPAFLANFPQCHVQLPAENCTDRLVMVWLRSIRRWLDHFAPWKEAVYMLTTLLLSSSFLADIMYHDIANHAMKAHVAVSRISTFLRYLEELLTECHELALAAAVFIRPDYDVGEGSDSESSDEEDEQFGSMSMSVMSGSIMKATVTPKVTYSRRIMTLSVTEREKLLERCKLSIAYASIWAFGGVVSGTDHQKFFNTVFREVAATHISPDLQIPDETNVFDLIVNLEMCRLSLAVEGDGTSQRNDGVPTKYEDSHLYADLTSSGSNYKLNFRTPSTRALDSASRLIIASGGNLLLFGQKSCGKSQLLQDILLDLSSNSPTPQEMRDKLVDHLVDTLYGRSELEGVPHVLDTMRRTLVELQQLKPIHDNTTTFANCWQVVKSGLQKLRREDARHHCQAKIVYNAATSLQCMSTAETLRSWLSREFSSENSHVLEAPRNSYGIIFVDDLHCSSAADGEIVSFHDRPEAFLKAMLESTPAFGIKRDLEPIIDKKSRIELLNPSGHMNRQPPGRPIMHRSFNSDPRRKSSEPNDFIMQHLGVVAAASDSMTSFLQSNRCSQLLPYFNVLSMPLFTTQQLHVALIAGANVCMSSVLTGYAGSSIQLLMDEIIEMSRITMYMFSKMISSSDIVNTTPLERALRSFSLLDVSLVARFCEVLRFGSKSVSNPGGLLQLYAHEWKRYFIDPLPVGTQRDRFVALLKSQLNPLDVKVWAISKEWLVGLELDLLSSTDRVWVDSSVLCSDSISSYLPLELNFALMTKSHLNGSWNAEVQQFRESSTPEDLLGKVSKVITVEELPNDMSVDCVLYPAAVAMLLRIVRIFTSSRKHLLLCGYYGTTRMTAVRLAASMCGFTLQQFDCREAVTAGETTASDKAILAASFTRFLKAAVLTISGLQQLPNTKINDDEVSIVNAPICAVVGYRTVPPVKTLIVITGCQQMSRDDKFSLLAVVDFCDPITLFEDFEVIGMAEALRKQSQVSANSEAESLTCAVSAHLHRVEEEKHTLIRNRKIVASDDGALSDAVGDWRSNDNVGKSAYQLSVEQGGFASLVEASRVQDVHKLLTKPVFKSVPVLTGYAFNWIKRRLSAALSSNSSVVLDVDLPRSMKLVANSFSKHQVESSHVASTAEKQKRFSLITKNLREGSLRSPDPRSVAESLLKRPVASSAVETVVVNDDTADSSASKVGAAIDPYHSIGIMTCPIVGPMLGRRFNAVWWDIDGTEAVHGICGAKMKNMHQENSHVANESSLCLQSSSVGMFFVADDDGEAAQEKTVTKDKSARIAAKKREREIRKQRFGLRTIVNSFNIVIKNSQFANSGKSVMSYIGSTCQKFGIFQSFDGSCSSRLNEEQTCDLDNAVAALIDESRAILPHLLSLRLAGDALILEEPLLHMGPEHSAELASCLVMNLLRCGGRNLLHRRMVLNVVLDGMKELVTVLDTSDEIRNLIVSQTEKTQEAQRKLGLETKVLRQEMGDIHTTHERSAACEALSMLKEEVHSVKFNFEYLEFRLVKSLEMLKQHVSSFTSYDWTSFAKVFAGKPGPEHILLMRAVMAMIGFVPPKSGRGGSEKSRNSDEAVARHGNNLLKSATFDTLIKAVSPLSLSSKQITAIKGYNLTLSDSFVHAPPGLELEYALMDDLESDVHPIFETLRKLLLVVEVYISSNATIVDMKAQVVVLESQLRSVEFENKKLLESYEKVLTAQSELLSDQTLKLDVIVMNNRSKLDSLSQAREHSAAIKISVRATCKYMETEAQQLDDILQTLVADTCIAASVLVRVGWLAESLRQDCLRQLRAEMAARNIRCSDCPFIAGSLMDRLQMRYWTSFSSVHSVCRDPASLNSYSLAMLSPCYTVVVDSEGCADSTLCEHVPDGFDLCVVSAQKFTLSNLEGWVALATDLRGADAAIMLVISDAQAGLSDDLVTFLSADLRVRSSAPGTESRLVAEFFDEARAVKGVAAHMNLCKLSVFLVSSRYPTMDENGICRPFPLCALKNCLIVNWHSNLGIYGVPKLGDTMLAKLSVDDSWLHNRMTHTLSSSVSSESLTALKTTNEKIIHCTRCIYDLQNKGIMSLFRWLQEDKPLLMRPIVIPNVIELPAISLGFTVCDNLIKELVQIKGSICILKYDMDKHQRHERDLLCYQAALGESLCMSLDYVRMCGVVLCEQGLLPFALTAAALCKKALAPAVKLADSRQLLQLVPTSLYSMHIISRGIRLFQKLLRRHLASRPSRQQGAPDMPTAKKTPVAPSVPRSLNQVDALASLRGAKLLSSSSRSGREYKPAVAAAVQPIVKKEVPVPVDKPSNLSGEAGAVVHLASAVRVKVLTLRERLAASCDLATLMVPLRLFFLREIARYVQSCTQPGAEWLSKITMMLAMWSHSASFPTEELRAYTHLLHHDSQSARYGHYVPYSESLPMRVKVKSPGRSLSSLPHLALLDRVEDSTVTEEVDEEDWQDEADENDDDSSNAMTTILPTTPSISHRVTAFRVNVGFTDSKIAVKKLTRMSVAHVQRAVSILRPHSRWMQKGAGVLDGLALSSRSPLWRLRSAAAEHNMFGRRSRRIDNNQSSRVSLTLADTPDSDLVVKDWRDKTVGDGFEVEWQQGLGVKLFSPCGVPAAIAMGASEEIAEAISTRMTTLLSPSRGSVLLSAGAAAGGRSSVRSSSAGFRRSHTSRQSSLSMVRKSTLAVGMGEDGSRSSRNSRMSFKGIGLMSCATPDAPVDNRSSRAKLFGIKTLAESASLSGNFSDAAVARLQNMMSGVGNHRNSLSATDPRSIRNTFKFPDNKKSEICSTDKIEAVFGTNANIVKNLYMLENHTCLAPVFRGVIKSMNKNIEDFVKWKESMHQLISVDPLQFSDVDLVELLARVKPPDMGLAEDDQSNTEGAGLGLWAKGQELTVLQSLILCEAVMPGSSGQLSEIVFALVASFLKKDGKILKHSDEVSDPHDEEFEYDDDDDDDDDCDDNNEDKNIREQSDNEYDEDEEGEGEDELGQLPLAKSTAPSFIVARSSIASQLSAVSDCGARARASLCDGVPITNCWTKLRLVISGVSAARGPVLAQSQTNSTYRMTCRDYQDWECVFLDFLVEEPTLEKYVFSKQLRDSMLGQRNVFFLAVHGSDNQMPRLSQRARDLAIRSDHHLPIFNCNCEKFSDGKDLRNLFMEVCKVIRSSSGQAATSQPANAGQSNGGSGQTFNQQRAIVEMLDITTPFGNAVVSSAVPGAAVNSCYIVRTLGIDEGSDREKSISKSVTQAVNSKRGLAVVIGAARSRDLSSLSKPTAMIVTAVHKASGFGQGPYSFLFEMTYSWLPRFFPPDVIGTTASACVAASLGQGPLPPALRESGSILSEELETSLLSVMHSIQRLTKSSLPPQARDRLICARKVEVRAISCLVTLWRLMLYLRSHRLETANRPGRWSECLVEPTGWQLVRLVIKVSDLFRVSWRTLMNIDSSTPLQVEDLQNNKSFKRAVCVCVEAMGVQVRAIKPAASCGPTLPTSGRASRPLSEERMQILTYRKHTVPKTAASLVWQKRLQKKANLMRLEHMTRLLEQLQAPERFLTVRSHEAACCSMDRMSSALDDDLCTRYVGLVTHFLADIISQHDALADFAEDCAPVASPSHKMAGVAAALGAPGATFKKISNKSEARSLLGVSGALTHGQDDLNNINDDNLLNIDLLDCDMTLGALRWQDIIKCLSLWSLDGAKKALNKSVKQKVLQAFRKTIVVSKFKLMAK